MKKKSTRNVNDYYDYHLTVGGLRKALEGKPDNTPVYYQRIEDAYFEKFGWQDDVVTLKENDGFLDWDDEYVLAHCVVRTDQKKGFFITAHY